MTNEEIQFKYYNREEDFLKVKDTEINKKDVVFVEDTKSIYLNNVNYSEKNAETAETDNIDISELETKLDNYAKTTSASLNDLNARILDITRSFKWGFKWGIISTDTYEIPEPSEDTTEDTTVFNIDKDIISGVPVYSMSFLYVGETNCIFTVNPDYNLIKVDGTDTLVGQGSTASVVIIENNIYLRIFNK